jgi:molecular chaperone DnaK
MIVGIDLGTSTSEIAVLRNGVPTLVREIAGSSHGFLPSVVAIGADGQLRVGEAATALLAVRPEASVAEVKRLMGTDKRVTLGTDSYTPQEISALILRHLKKEAEAALGEPVDRAVITVPAYFTALQRRATHDAGELAGLTVQRLINEPTAAALAYGIERPNAEEKVLVYDLGGGTFDVTVLELSEGVLDVMASTGNAALGGKDFDERLMTFLAATCKQATGTDLLAAPKSRARLRAAAKRAKEDLSNAASSLIVVDEWEYDLTRAAFEAQIEDLVQSTATQIDEALAQKKLKPEQINTILMIGGSSRVPFVRAFVSHYFGDRPLRTEVHPDEAVALGAAVLGGIEGNAIHPGSIVITDVAPWTLGVAVVEDRPGGRMSGIFNPLIEKQSTIPRSVTRMYATSDHWQSSILVEVYQGDAPMCANNLKVGEFELQLVERAPAGAPVEISFSYNLNGELEVVAKSLGASRRVVMRPSPQHMSEGEKQAARTRLEQTWAAAPPPPANAASEPAPPGSTLAERARHAPLYPRVAPLFAKAEQLLPGLSAGPRTRLDVLLLEMRTALIANDERVVGVVEQALTNLLFELA